MCLQQFTNHNFKLKISRKPVTFFVRSSNFIPLPPAFKTSFSPLKHCVSAGNAKLQHASCTHAQASIQFTTLSLFMLSCHFVSSLQKSLFYAGWPKDCIFKKQQVECKSSLWFTWSLQSSVSDNECCVDVFQWIRCKAYLLYLVQYCTKAICNVMIYCFRL